MHRRTQFSLHLEAMVLLRLPMGAVAALRKFAIGVPHVLSSFFKKVRIVVNYDVTLECHTQVVLHVKVIEAIWGLLRFSVLYAI